MSRVLVVDDDADVRDLAVRWLTAAGHLVLSADSGSAAVLWPAPSVMRMRQAGAAYLPKPSSEAGLRAAVRRLLTGAGRSSGVLS